VGQGGHAVIHGPPGTGKSTVLTGIITTALANQRRVLMVCEKKAALDVIANRLDQLGLHHVYALIQDTTADRKAVVTKARAIHDNLPSLPEIPVG
jgi:predicted ATP-dependent serine protease